MILAIQSLKNITSQYVPKISTTNLNDVMVHFEQLSTMRFRTLLPWSSCKFQAIQVSGQFNIESPNGNVGISTKESTVTGWWLEAIPQILVTQIIIPNISGKHV